jgi:NAD(P)H-nitrite reductase large subunit
MTNNIVIVGNSAAGFGCFLELSQALLDAQITVFSQEDQPAYNKSLLCDYLAGIVKEQDLYLCGKEFYSKNKINFLKDTKVVKIDTRKKLVVSKESKVPYDILVIASGVSVKAPDVPGTNKDGFFILQDLSQAKKLKQRIMLGQTICLTGDSALCGRLYGLLQPGGKEIKVVSTPVPQGVTVAGHNEWIDSLQISEYIAEGPELKAIKLNSGKVIAVSVVVYTQPGLPAGDFLKDSGIALDQGFVTVDGQMRTNIEDIYACGSIALDKSGTRANKSWQSALEEGAAAAKQIIQVYEGRKTVCQQIS